MKKKTGIYNETSGRKWRLICITLVLIFSVISISATGAESKTNSQTGDKIVHESDTGVSNETEDNCLYCIVDENYAEVDCFDCTESGEDNNTGDKCSYCIESDEKNNTGSKCSSCTKSEEKDENEDECLYCIEDEENLEQKSGGNSTETPETVVYNKSKTGTGTSTKIPETVIDNKSKTGTGTSTETQKTVVYNKSKTGSGTSTETQKTVVDNKSKTGSWTSTETQKTVVYNKSKTGTGTSTETPETVIDNKSKTGTGTSTETPETVVDNKSKTGTGTSTETPETVIDNKSKTGSGISTETPETVIDNKSKTGSGTSTETQETVIDNKSKTGSGTSTETQETVIDNKSKTGAEGSAETPETVVDNKSKAGSGTSTETQETVEDTEQGAELANSLLHYNVYKIGENKSTETQETVEDNKSKTEAGTSTETQEDSEENDSKSSETNVSSGYKLITVNKTVAQENESDSEDTDSQENSEENDSKSSETNVSSGYKLIAVNKTVAQENESDSEDTDSQENSKENDSKSSETNVSNGYKLITANKTVAQENESDSENTDSQEYSEKNDSTSSKSNGSNCKCKIITANKTAVNENKTTSSESNVSDLKYKIITANGTVVQNNTNAKNETKTETVTEPKSVKSSEVVTETKTSNETSKGTETSNGTGTSNDTGTSSGTNSVESEVVKSEENWTNSLSQEVNEIKVYNWTDSQGNESETPKIKTEKNSWNNIKLILSYSYPLRSFYTTNDNVNISYNGPEALGHQNVDIYLIKKYSPSSPENGTSYNINESTISLEDVLNNDTEAYVKIPATLNKEGDLTPLRLDPLQAGHYWILITPAENEEENTGSENKVLLAKYFEVLQYQLEARAPYALQEGENLEVSLDLKNASNENNYTYWVVLIKDSAYTAFEGTNPTWRMTTGIRPIVNGVDLIKSLETNLSGHESENEKNELRHEIQTLIGKDNGTISIGEKNQNNLSLKSLDLPPGNYLLLTGAYENNEGLTGISQGNLRISAENLSGLGLKPGSENTFGDESSTKFKDSPLMGIKSILENPKSFILEDVKPYIQANSLAEVLRNPPKLPSFLLGFAVTLLIGFAVLRKKK